MDYKSMSLSQDRIERRAVADNPDCPCEILIYLSKDENPKVRCSVALHKNTPVEILIELSNDSYDSVRRNVAENENTPANVVQALAWDKDSIVREYAEKTLKQRAFDFYTKE